MQPWRLLSTVLSLLGAAAVTAAFSFSFGDPTECDNLNVTWTGGTAPYHLLITPAFGVAQNISIPASAYSNGRGSFQTQLTLAQSKTFLLTMGDATGENSGGTSNVLTVGKSLGGSCNTTTSSAPFTFRADTALVQCRTMTFNGYDKAIQPVRILGLIPAGDMVELDPPTGSTSYDWIVDVAGGNSMIFLMVDSQNRQGGSSNMFTVGQSDASDCLTSDAPSSTQSAPSATASATASSSTTALPASSSAPASESHDSGTSTGVIIGIVAAIVLTLAILAGLAMFFIKRRRARQEWSPSQTRHSRKMGSVDLLQQSSRPDAPDTPTAYRSPYGAPGRYNDSSHDVEGGRATSPFDDPPTLPDGYQPRPFMLATPTQYAPSERLDEGPTSPRDSMAPSTSTSTRRTKAQMAGLASYEPASRYIVHTDLDDEPKPNADGFIELPPQYSESRQPQRVFAAQLPPVPSIPEQAGPAVGPDPFASVPPSRRPSDDAPRGHPPPLPYSPP